MPKSKRKQKRRVAKKGAFLHSCPRAVKTRRLKSGPWIQRGGKLGGPGYTERSSNERHHILKCSLDKYGYRSTLGSLQVLLRGRASPEAKSVVRKDIGWLKTHHG